MAAAVMKLDEGSLKDQPLVDANLRQVLAEFPDARPLSIAEILHWPGVLADESLSPDRATADRPPGA